MISIHLFPNPPSPILFHYTSRISSSSALRFAKIRKSSQFNSTTMSWMDSWSRPSKPQAVPPPFYLTSPNIKYCHTCGRVISDRKSHRSDTTPAKYCSIKCRSQKSRAKDLRIEEAFVTLLHGGRDFEGEEVPQSILGSIMKTKAKGEKRVIVPCSAAETLVYGSREDPNKIYGRKKNRASRALIANRSSEWRSADMESGEEDEDATAMPFNATGFAGKVRPPQKLNDVNGSVGGEKGRAERIKESEEALAKRLEGQKIADQKEMVKRAARRLCVFGSRTGVGDGEATKMCEAVMNGKVVEPSFAKGDWGLRWRE